jgi:DNA topoisomerase-1
MPSVNEVALEAELAPKVEGRTLVVVESPTKQKTLHKYLGKDYFVLASKGHLIDLPKGGLGIDIEHDFEPEYVPIASKAEEIARIRIAARHARGVLLASDPDREGEAIAWHIARLIEGVKAPVQRITFNEITQRAVLEALEHARDLETDLVDAQQARRVLDRLVGYKVSPFLWGVLFFGRLSAGRVQSVALRIICEREEQILAFVPEEYWTLEADYATPAGERFTARLVRIGEERLENAQLRGPEAGARMQRLAEQLAQAPARITALEVKPKRTNPKPPFTTSTLQQAASNRYGFNSERTMQVAQRLFEGVEIKGEGSVGLISYIRTDSPRLSVDTETEIREWLKREHGADSVPEQPNRYKGRKDSQDAHEAIRPTEIARTPESLRAHLSDEQFKLYDLIWKRTVASQALPAQHDQTTVEIAAGDCTLRASGSVLRVPGWLKVYGRDEEAEAEEGRLPSLEQGASLVVAAATEEPAVRAGQHFTQPPPRFNDASLVKALEEEGIGRPSTYASIVKTITARLYVERDGRSLKPTELGMLVTRLLVEHFPDLFNVGFTAGMENELDEVEEGKRPWRQVVRDLWEPLSHDLEELKGRQSEIKRGLQKVTDIDCPSCGQRKLIEKYGANGKFLACPRYPTCRYTQPLDPSELPVPVEGRCGECGAGLVARKGPFGRYIHCERRPDCRFTKPFTLGITCPKCGTAELAEKRTRAKGKIFYSCVGYPACDFSMWDPPVAVPCPECGSPVTGERVLKTGTKHVCPLCVARARAKREGAGKSRSRKGGAADA